MEESLELLCSAAKLERDRGVTSLKRWLGGLDPQSPTQLTQNESPTQTPTQSSTPAQGELGAAVASLETELCAQLSALSPEDAPATHSQSRDGWESRHGALMAAKILLDCGKASVSFAERLAVTSLHLLNDGESRVRLVCGEVLGSLCKTLGVNCYSSSKATILNGIQENLERKPLEEDTSASESESVSNLVDKLAPTSDSTRRGSADAEQIFHDTAGWKFLETYMKCLQSVIEGCGAGFNQFIDADLLSLVFQTLNHTNRFVRETGYYVCGSLVSCNSGPDGSNMSTSDNEIYKNGAQFAQQLSLGLADNWSQVRLAASVATRRFLEGLSASKRSEFYALLLPPMCLNRYYVAEGVRIYSQDTWKSITAGEGKQLLEQHIEHVVAFYVSQSEADNHAVREAACACIAELGSKIDRDVVRKFIPELLDALLVCFKDDSWPVRDASCVACGNFVLCFPEESRSSLESLYPLFYDNLQDNIASVREGAAIALANVVRAYGNDALDPILAKLVEGLKGVESQPANTEKYAALDTGVATYGVVKRLRDNDLELHSDKQMYSCGSLAPKMHRGKRGGGCMDHQFRKPSEPWELGDGCVCLLGELSQVSDATKQVTSQLPLLAKAASYQHYTQHVHFLETLWKQLPVIAKGIGKRTFKSYLELFLDPLFYSLRCDNALTVTATTQCFNALSTLLGPNILQGRIEQYNPSYLREIPVSHPPGLY